MKKILSFFVALLCVGSMMAQYDTWSLVGNHSIMNGTADWAIAATENDMTTEDGVNYTITVTGKVLEAGTNYQFKYAKDHAWAISVPQSGNLSLSVLETATYDIVFSVNVSTGVHSEVPTKAGEAGEVTHVYSVAGGSAALFGAQWSETATATEMTKGENGIYSWTAENVELAAGNIEYKVVVDHAWGTAYPSSGNATLAIAEAATYNVVFTFNPADKAVNATATKVGGESPEPEPEVVAPYCQAEVGHFFATNADPNSFVLLSIGAVGDSTIVRIDQDAAKNSQTFDYLQVSGHASAGADVAEGGETAMAVKFKTPAATNDSITLEILWSTVNWAGRWMVQNVKVPAAATCASAVIPVPEPVVTRDTVMYVAGSFTNWAKAMQALPYSVTLPKDSTIEFKQVRIITTSTDGVATAADTAWFGQATANYQMTRANIGEGWTLNGQNNVLLTTDIAGEYTFSLNEAGAFVVAFPALPGVTVVKDTAMYVAGSFTNWATDMQALPYSVTLPADSALEFKQVRIITTTTTTEGVETPVVVKDTAWLGQTTANYQMTRANIGEGWTLNGQNNVLLTTDIAGEYTFAINEAGAFVVTFPAMPTAPAAAPAAPAYPANQVKAVYSATYEADCDFGEWGSGTACTQETYGKKYVTAANGYFGICFEGTKALNCSNMESLHLDIWAAESFTLRIVPIHGGTEVGVSKQVKAGRWNSIDIALTEFEGVSNWSNVYQIKIDNASNHTFWVNNVYFYTTVAPAVDTEAPTAVSATLASVNYVAAKLTVSATDNSGAVIFVVKNGENVLTTENGVSETEKVIMVPGLTAGQNYNLSVIAKDETGNEAEAVAVAVNVPALPAFAVAPVAADSNVLAIYTTHYTEATTMVNANENWWNGPSMSAMTNGDDKAYYYYGEMGGCFGIHYNAIDATAYDALTLDIYPANTGSIKIALIDASAQTVFAVKGGEWNHIVLSIEGNTKTDNIQVGLYDYATAGEFLVQNVMLVKKAVSSETTHYVAGSFTNWAAGMQALPYNTTLAVNDTIQFKQVDVTTTTTTYASTVVTNDTVWYGQATANYVMTRESMTETGWVLNGESNVILVADAAGEYTFSLTEAGAFHVAFPALPEPTGYTVTVTINGYDPDGHMDYGYAAYNNGEEFVEIEGSAVLPAGTIVGVVATSEDEARIITATVNGEAIDVSEGAWIAEEGLAANMAIVITFADPEPEPEPEPEPAGSGLYIVGTINSWNVAQAAYEMTTVTEGFEFTFDFGETNLVGQNFKITDATKSDWSDATINLGMGTDKLNPTTAIALYHGSNTNISVADGYTSATNVVITLKYVMGEWILSATGNFVSGQAAIPDLYLRGINGDWSATEDNKFTKNEDNWTLTLDVTDGSSFKVADANWGDYNFGGSDEADLELNEPYTLVSGSNVNLALPAEAAPGSYTFTLTKSEAGVWALTVVCNDIPTAIDNVELNEVRKLIENGQVVIIKNGVKFNIMGAKL